jgi:hypothetical protein
MRVTNSFAQNVKCADLSLIFSDMRRFREKLMRREWVAPSELVLIWVTMDQFGRAIFLNPRLTGLF